MDNYYAEKLNSQKLFQVYDSKIPRVKQYLQAEIDFVKNGLSPSQSVLELGAGYGRIVKELAPFCGSILGVDISEESAALGREYLKGCPNAKMLAMDAHKLTFSEKFDVVLCLQNGLSAMRADASMLEGIFDVMAEGGAAYFSSYSAKFWDVRLQWFEEQAQKGLLGELDYSKTKDGVIVCKDGFRATTHSPEDFEKIGRASGYPYEVCEVDESSVFLIIRKN